VHRGDGRQRRLTISASGISPPATLEDEWSGATLGDSEMAERRLKRAALLAAPLLFLAAATDTPLSPGLWEVKNIPTAMSLDGKLLDDVPLGEAKTQRICLASAQAADPAAFFARDTQEECKLTQATAAAGKVDIKGTCPNPEEGNEGSLSLSGRYASDSYELDFSSTAEDFQGVMTFKGKLTGRRIGPCPAAN
jgi:Protein of unknown function (DUF3617)